MKMTGVISPRILYVIRILALASVLLSLFTMGCSQKMQQRADEVTQSFFDAAKLFVNQEKYEDAIDAYSKLEKLTKDPREKALAKHGMASSYFKLAQKSENINHYVAAKKNFDWVIENSTDPRYMEDALFMVATILTLLNRDDEAIGHYMKFKRQFPQSPLIENALYQIGVLYRKLQSYENSRRHLNQLLEDFPSSMLFRKEAQREIAQSFFDEAKFFFDKSKYELARNEFDKHLESGKFNNYLELQAEAMHIAAVSEKNLGNEAMHKAGHPDPDIADSYRRAGRLHFDEALTRYTNFCKKFPTNSAITYAYYTMGQIYELLHHQYDKARENYQLALENAKDQNWQAECQDSIARIYVSEGDFQKVIAAYTSLLETYTSLLEKLEKDPPSDRVIDEKAIDEKVTKAKFHIANSHFRLENWKEAIRAYERVIVDYKEAEDGIPYCSYQIAEASYRLATEQREDGNTQEASESFETALSQYQSTLSSFPTDAIAPHALYGIMSVLNDLGRKGELECLLLERGISPFMLINGVPDLDLKGLSYFKLALTQEKYLKDYKGALESYQKAIPLVQTPLIKAQSYYRCGVISQDYLDPPDKDKASELFQTLISEYGNSEDKRIASLVADARNRCTKLKGHPLELTSKDIAQIASGSTVLVETNPGGSGSGFFVGPGQIVTNYHVIEGAVKATARLVGTERKYTIVGYTAVDAERDLAILQVRDHSVKPLPLEKKDGVDRGIDVYPTGNPLGHKDIFTAGKISGIKWVESTRNFLKEGRSNDKPTPDTPQKLFVMTADVTSGSSGGPVLNDDGKVIGVVVGESLAEQSLNYAIPVDLLNELLRKVGPPKPLQQAGLAK